MFGFQTGSICGPTRPVLWLRRPKILKQDI
jgi:hypothetical protein